MDKQETDEIMEKVRFWLTEEEIFRDEIKDENANYHFIAEFPNKSSRIIDIIQPKQKRDLIIIGSVYALNKENYEKFASMPKSTRDNVLGDFTSGLLFRTSQFRIKPSSKDFQKIEFTCPLYFDGLTKNMFMSAVRENYHCNLYVHLNIIKCLPNSTKENEMDMYW